MKVKDQTRTRLASCAVEIKSVPSFKIVERKDNPELPVRDIMMEGVESKFRAEIIAST